MSGYNTTQALKVCVCRGRHGTDIPYPLLDGTRRKGHSAIDQRLTVLDTCPSNLAARKTKHPTDHHLLRYARLHRHFEKQRPTSTNNDPPSKVPTTRAFQTRQAVRNKTSPSRLSLQIFTLFFRTRTSPIDTTFVSYSSRRLQLMNASYAPTTATSQATTACDALQTRRHSMWRLSDRWERIETCRSAMCGVL